MTKYQTKEEWCEALYQAVLTLTGDEAEAQEYKDMFLMKEDFQWGQNPMHLAEMLTM